MTLRSYQESLEQLFGLHPRGIKLGLGRMRAAVRATGHPQRRFASVLVAGTNGKGSTSALLAGALQAAGLRTGLFTSPHVERFEERIRVNGRLLPRQRVPELVERALSAANVTFFEAATLMAFLHFADEAVDVAVLEIGMGGRLDATNVVSPELSIVTPVGRDHLKTLGPTLPDVMGEKLGILRRGRPVVMAAQRPVVERALPRLLARRPHGPVHRVPGAAACIAGAEGWNYEGPAWRFDGLHLAMPGDHQGGNLACAMLAAELLSGRLGFPPPRAARLRQRLAAVAMPARLQRFTDAGGRVAVVDGAHNEDAARRVSQWLRSSFPDGYVLLFGCLRDKPPRTLLGLLGPGAQRLVVTEAPGERAMDPARSFSAALKHCAHAQPELEIGRADALARGLALAAECRRPLVVAGSLYLAGEAIIALKTQGFRATPRESSGV